jgi:exopolysaccharide production protein ExoQ
VLFFLFRILRWRRKKALVLLSIVGTALILVTGNLVLQNFSQFMNLLGKDPTMTGRLPIWQECLHFVGMKPFLGYGYGAFWTVTSHPARLIREAVDWDTLPHAHNGYIDLLLALGVVGLLLYAAVNSAAGWRAVLHVREYSDADAMWPLAFLCVTLLYQLDEASIISANQLIWILFSSVIFSLGIEAEQRVATGAPAEEESYAAEVPAGG